MPTDRENKRATWMPVYSVDFVKACDTVTRELLFIILGKLGCPPKFIRIIKKLYTDVHARLAVDGEFTQSFEYNSGIKQGCKLSPTRFSFYAAVLLWLAFKKIKHACSVQIRLHHDGDLLPYADSKKYPKSLQSLSQNPSTLMTLQFSVTRQRARSRY